MEIAILIIGLSSPTFWVASLLKQEVNKSKVIRLLNWVYFLFAILSVLAILIIELSLDTGFQDFLSSYLVYVIWSIYLLSRCSEIYVAFLRDAIDKVSGAKSESRGKWWPRWLVRMKNGVFAHEWISRHIKGSSLQNHDRLALSFRSYFELIANFAILYSLTPATFWKDCKNPDGILESGYFSGVTITTLGYGDITPVHWFPQFLTVFEVLCGFALIVVCFAVYLQKEKNG